MITKCHRVDRADAAPARAASRSHAHFAALVVVLAMSWPTGGSAQTGAAYPAKPVRLIIPFPPGSSTNDTLGRGLAQPLSRALGQQVVVDNRPGAGGTVGTEAAARAAPDGYTLVLGINGPLAIGPSVYSKLGYDPVQSFAPVALIATVPYVIVTNPALPVRSVKQLIALAKARPGQLMFASSGTGGTPHLCLELFKAQSGTDIVHVPYKGAPAVADTIAGHVQIYCPGLTAVNAHIRSGKLRAIGIASRTRSPLMPELPTISEQGLTGFEVSSWTGLLAPAGTPEPIVRRLYEEIVRIVNTSEMKEFLFSQGAEPTLMDPVEFGAHLRAEIAKWSVVVKAAKIRLD